MKSDNKTLMSGIQPSGAIHIGNFIGAISNWLKLQNEYESYFSIADLHAITVKYDINIISERIFDITVVLLASGIDPEKCHLFVQSSVKQHTELAWFLNTVTPMGELSRMTQFKDKSRRNAVNINVGLFDYPVLQTSDIVLYKAKYVPVGEDQVQHIELAREIVRKFNARFGETFPEPMELLTHGKRIMGLDGKSKMSKSLNNYIALDEPKDKIWEKLKPAFTDPQRLRRKDPGRPELCNIFSMHGFFSSPEEQAEIKTGCTTAGIGCFDCKKRLLNNMMNLLDPLQAKMADIKNRPDYVKDILSEGAKFCRRKAEQTMNEVYEKTGLAKWGN